MFDTTGFKWIKKTSRW